MAIPLVTRTIRKRPELAYAVGASLFAVAFAMRVVLEGLEGLPFITFLPAVVLAGLAGGLRAGLVCALLGGVAAWYFFVQPFSSFAVRWPWGAVSMALYAASAGIILYVIEELNQAVDRLTEERDRAEVLFTELQHRVANNMSLIAALLRLQRRGLPEADGAAAQALDEAQRRIEVVGRIHRRLYDPTTERLPISTVLQELCTDILEVSGAQRVVCNVTAPEVTFQFARLLPVSVVVMEAVTNGLKYAFEDGQQGTISIDLQQLNGTFELRVSDNGRAAAGVAAKERSTGLGTRMMDAFARQLGGKLEVGSAGTGTVVRVTFPD